MLRRFRIAPRLVGSVMAGGVLVVGLTLGAALHLTGKVLLEAEQRELREVYGNVLAALEAEGRAAQTLSALVAGIPQVQAAFAAGDRDALAALFVPGYKRLDADYGIRQFQFHLPPATSFLRVHKPEKFGDDLSAFRHTVVAANAGKKPIKGLEAGVAGLGIRGIEPVAHAGTHVGTVEFGMSFGQAFFDEFARKYQVDLALHLRRDGRFEVFGSTFGDARPLDAGLLERAFDGESVNLQTELEGRPVAVLAGVVNDYSGVPIGALVVAKDRGFYAEQLASIRLLVGGIGVAGLLGLGLLAWLVGRQIAAPLVRTVGSMQEIAAGGGDLCQRLDTDGRDEVADLARAFNRFAETIRDIVVKVSATAGNLGSAASELSDASRRTHDGMQRQVGETTQIAAAMTEMSSTVQEVARNAAETAQAANKADRLAGDGNAVVVGTLDAINRLARDVERAAAVVRRVDEHSTRIGSVLDVIRGIAEQTNLLALNAAIEAARAGDQGRGFSVVAEEVRSLAQRTQESTREIQEMIESLQGGVDEAVRVMEESHTRAGASVEQAARAGESLTSIAASVDTITTMSTQIATASEQQSQVAEGINRSVVNIAHVTEATASDARHATEASERIAVLMGDLLESVSRFRTGKG